MSLRSAASRAVALARQHLAPRGTGRPTQQTRGMSGGHGEGHGAGHDAHDSVTYAGLTIHKASTWHVRAAEAMGGLMVFWILLRCKEDGHAFIYGHAGHWEHSLHEHEHEESGHGHDHGQKHK